MAEQLHETLEALRITLESHGAALSSIDPSFPIPRSPGTETPPDSPAENLVYDVEDLRKLTGTVTRLVKTLHEGIDAVKAAERRLLQEADEVAVEVMDVGREGDMMHGYDFKRAISFDVHSVPPSRGRGPARPEWNDEKEAQLKDLEMRLRTANKKWSAEQEDVLQYIEPLKEERRKALKLQRRDSKMSMDSERSRSVSSSRRPSSALRNLFMRKNTRKLRAAVTTD